MQIEFITADEAPETAAWARRTILRQMACDLSAGGADLDDPAAVKARLAEMGWGDEPINVLGEIAAEHADTIIAGGRAWGRA